MNFSTFVYFIQMKASCWFAFY